MNSRCSECQIEVEMVGIIYAPWCTIMQVQDSAPDMSTTLPQLRQQEFGVYLMGHSTNTYLLK